MTRVSRNRDILTVADVAKTLGVNRATLCAPRWVGGLPWFAVGRERCLYRRDLDAAIASGNVPRAGKGHGVRLTSAEQRAAVAHGVRAHQTLAEIRAASGLGTQRVMRIIRADPALREEWRVRRRWVRNFDRTEILERAAREGWTLDRIASSLGVTRERARQILLQHGLTDLRVARYAVAADLARWERLAIRSQGPLRLAVAWALAAVGLPVEVELLCGTKEAIAVRLDGQWLCVHFRRTANPCASRPTPYFNTTGYASDRPQVLVTGNGDLHLWLAPCPYVLLANATDRYRATTAALVLVDAMDEAVLEPIRANAYDRSGRRRGRGSAGTGEQKVDTPLLFGAPAASEKAA